MSYEIQNDFALERRLRSALVGLDESKLQRVVAAATRVMLTSGESLPACWRVGHVVILSSGILFVEGRQGAKGGTPLLRSIHPQHIVLWPKSLDPLGESAAQNMFSYQTSECLVIAEDIFEEALSESRGLQQHLMLQLCEANRSAIDRVHSLALHKVEGRLQDFRDYWEQEVGLALGRQFKPSLDETARFVGASVGTIQRFARAL